MTITVRTVEGRAYGGAKQPELVMRSEGAFDSRVYQRTYYHTTRKYKTRNRSPLTPRQRLALNAARRDYYYRNLAEERRKARERMRNNYARKKKGAAR